MQSLTEKSRSVLYRALKKGELDYQVSDDGKAVFYRVR